VDAILTDRTSDRIRVPGHDAHPENWWPSSLVRSCRAVGPKLVNRVSNTYERGPIRRFALM
jgi:hypothetical protein